MQPPLSKNAYQTAIARSLRSALKLSSLCLKIRRHQIMSDTSVKTSVVQSRCNNRAPRRNVAIVTRNAKGPAIVTRNERGAKDQPEQTPGAKLMAAPYLDKLA